MLWYRETSFYFSRASLSHNHIMLISRTGPTAHPRAPQRPAYMPGRPPRPATLFSGSMVCPPRSQAAVLLDLIAGCEKHPYIRQSVQPPYRSAQLARRQKKPPPQPPPHPHRPCINVPKARWKPIKTTTPHHPLQRQRLITGGG